MSRDDPQRLDDIAAALDAITDYLARGNLHDGLVFDAVRMRLIEIGEAVKGLSAESRAREPRIPWSEIAGLRDHLTHRYFDTVFGVIAGTVETDLGDLREAIGRLRYEPPLPILRPQA